MNKINKKKFLNLEQLLLIIYSFILLLGILHYSEFSFSNIANKLENILIILLWCISIFGKHTREQWILFLIGVSICGISILLKTTDKQFLWMMIVAFSISCVSTKKILTYSYRIICLSLILLAILALLGIIPNLTYFRDNAVRQSLGTIYPLTFAGFAFYGCIAYISCQNKQSIQQILLVLIIAGIIYKFTGARNDTFCLLLLIISILSTHFKDVVNKIILIIGSISVLLISVLSIFITNIVPYYTNTYFYINKLFSGRLYLQSILLNLYHLNIWGQVIPQNGLGGSQGPIYNYFYIDNSYTRLFFMYGVLFGIFLIFLFCRLLYLFIDLKAFKYAYILLIIMISGITEDSFINPAINIFLYLLLIDKLAFKKDMVLNE